MRKRRKSESEHIGNIIPVVLKSIAERTKARKGEKTHERLTRITV